MPSNWHTLQVTAGSLIGLVLPLVSQREAPEPPKPVAEVTVVRIQEDGDKAQARVAELEKKVAELEQQE
jgi:hypothetical protein